MLVGQTSVRLRFDLDLDFEDELRGRGWLNNRRKSIVLINAAMMTCNYDGNGDNKVKDDDADLKSPELVRVIPVLALHVARPDQQQ